MKKLLALILTGALSMGALAACGTTAVVAVPPPSTPPAATPAPRPPQGGSGAVKTGLFLDTSVSASKSAAAGEDGLGQTDVTLVAVTVTDEGVINSCVIDSIQSKVGFDASGAITADLTAPVPSKNELGESYGMKKYSGIGKEWNEQAQALADYVEGKTLDEVMGISVNEKGAAAGADLAASVTISIAGYLDAIQQAVNSAVHLGAQQGDQLVLTTSTNISGSSDAAADAEGTAQTYTTAAALTLNGDTITSCTIDAVQADVKFDASGVVTTDLTAPVASKNQLGDAYGMKKYSGIGKEWYEQAAGFAQYVTGKTLSEAAGISVNESGKAADADLAASVTISIGDFMALVAKAGA